jgi:hypothetical protein
MGLIMRTDSVRAGFALSWGGANGGYITVSRVPGVWGARARTNPDTARAWWGRPVRTPKDGDLVQDDVGDVDQLGPHRRPRTRTEQVLVAAGERVRRPEREVLREPGAAEAYGRLVDEEVVGVAGDGGGGEELGVGVDRGDPPQLLGDPVERLGVEGPVRRLGVLVAEKESAGGERCERGDALPVAQWGHSVDVGVRGFQGRVHAAPHTPTSIPTQPS